jgi:hypothetical protein
MGCTRAWRVAVSVGLIGVLAAMSGCTMSGSVYADRAKAATDERDDKALLGAIDSDVKGYTEVQKLTLLVQMVTQRAEARVKRGDRKPLAATVGKVVAEASRRDARVRVYNDGWNYVSALLQNEKAEPEFVESELRALMVTWPDGLGRRHAIFAAEQGNERLLALMLQISRPDLATALCTLDLGGTRPMQVTGPQTDGRARA